MLRNFTLQPNEDKKLQIEGKFLVVTQASGPVELTIGGTTPLTVDAKDRIHLRNDSPNDRAVRIRNVSGGVNNIEFHTSDLLVDKRTGVDVTNEIQIAEQQRIGIDPLANIVQAIIQNAVRLDTNNNTIKIDPNANAVKSEIQNAVRLDQNSNTVKIDQNANSVVLNAAGNTVQIDPDSNRVSFSELQLIGINPALNKVVATISEPVQLQDDISVSINQRIRTPKRYRALATIQIKDVTVHSIEPQDQREQLLLTAGANNVDVIWLADEPNKGLPLAPGEKVTLTTEQRVEFVGTPNDELFIAEIAFNG